MKAGGEAMKLLKIDNYCGHYRKESGAYNPIDKITKEELLQMKILFTKKEKMKFACLKTMQLLQE